MSCRNCFSLLTPIEETICESREFKDFSESDTLSICLECLEKMLERELWIPYIISVGFTPVEAFQLSLLKFENSAWGDEGLKKLREQRVPVPFIAKLVNEGTEFLKVSHSNLKVVDVDSISAWWNLGLSVFDEKYFSSIGISVETIVGFYEVGITEIDEILVWASTDVTLGMFPSWNAWRVSPLKLKEILDSGFDGETKNFEGPQGDYLTSGMTLDEAVRWIRNGFTGETGERYFFSHFQNWNKFGLSPETCGLLRAEFEKMWEQSLLNFDETEFFLRLQKIVDEGNSLATSEIKEIIAHGIN